MTAPGAPIFNLLITPFIRHPLFASKLFSLLFTISKYISGLFSLESALIPL